MQLSQQPEPSSIFVYAKGEFVSLLRALLCLGLVAAASALCVLCDRGEKLSLSLCSGQCSLQHLAVLYQVQLIPKVAEIK